MRKLLDLNCTPYPLPPVIYTVYNITNIHIYINIILYKYICGNKNKKKDLELV